MHGGEIAKDCMRFPDNELAVDQGRDLRGGIELAVCLRERVAELATVVLAYIGQTEFLQTEDDLLHVPRRLSPEQSDHVVLLSDSVRGSRIKSPTARLVRNGVHFDLVLITARASTVVR